MGFNKKIIVLITMFVTPFYCATKEDNNHYISVPVAGIHAKPDPTSVYISQKIYGHPIKLVKKHNNMWVKIATDDGLTGYCLHSDISSTKTSWHNQKNIKRIKSLMGCIYKTPDNRQQTLLRLPYNAYVKVLETSQDPNWTYIELIDGKKGWIRSNNLEEITPLSTKDVVKRSKQFLGLPYIWGGTSSFGFDCSGFVQTLAHQMGYPMLRNSRMQAEDKNLIEIPYKKIKPGDFVYFGKETITHTALCIGKNRIIHAAAVGDQDHLMITPLKHPLLNFKCARRLPSR